MQPENASLDLATLNDEELLQMRICDLKLKIAGTELESRIDKFYAELSAKDISVKPLCYLGDEWFCPEGSTTIAIPFYLAHPRLKKLEAKMMMEVEGDTEPWCLRLLRHEMGHVLNHAYCSSKDKRWQQLFGPPSLEYSESFRARPYSKRFVRHLDGYYAQSHPEEDFAETFAIWLTPDLDWRHQYQRLEGAGKIGICRQLMQGLPANRRWCFLKRKSAMRRACALALKPTTNAGGALTPRSSPTFSTAILSKLFADAEAAPDSERAATFLRRSNKLILNAVSAWTGEPKFTISRLLRGAHRTLRRARSAARSHNPPPWKSPLIWRR